MHDMYLVTCTRYINCVLVRYRSIRLCLYIGIRPHSNILKAESETRTIYQFYVD